MTKMRAMGGWARATGPAVAAMAMLAHGGGAQAARELPQTTPLAGPQLFISPCGKPYRSKAGDPYPVVAWFAEVDANKDGHIDLAEFRAASEAFFDVLDRDHDGLIDDSEVSYYERNLVPEVMAGVESGRLDRYGRPRLILVQMGGTEQIDPDASNADGSPPKLREDDLPFQGAAAYGLLNDAEPVRSADRTFVGRIKLADMLARADHNFQALDPNDRGYLTLEGLPRTPAQQQAKVARRR